MGCFRPLRYSARKTAPEPDLNCLRLAPKSLLRCLSLGLQRCYSAKPRGGPTPGQVAGFLRRETVQESPHVIASTLQIIERWRRNCRCRLAGLGRCLPLPPNRSGAFPRRWRTPQGPAIYAHFSAPGQCASVRNDLRVTHGHDVQRHIESHCKSDPTNTLRWAFLSAPQATLQGAETARAGGLRQHRAAPPLASWAVSVQAKFY